MTYQIKCTHPPHACLLMIVSYTYQIRILDNAKKLHADLDALQKWERDWLMEFLTGSL